MTNLPKFFTVNSFSLLIDVLESCKDPYTLQNEYENDISNLLDKLRYDREDLRSGEYETQNLKITVIEHYVSLTTIIYNYNVITK